MPGRSCYRYRGSRGPGLGPQIRRPRGIPVGERSIGSLTLAQALIPLGEYDRACQLVEQSGWRADRRTEALHYPVDVLVVAVRTLAAAGGLARAEHIARSATDPYQQSAALAGLVEALAGRGDAAGAEGMACSIRDPYWQSAALVRAARAMAARGESAEARRVIELAKIAANPITDAFWLAAARLNIIGAFAAIGEPGDARQLLESVRDGVQVVSDPDGRQLLVGALLKNRATMGRLDEAETIARAPRSGSNWDVSSTVELVEALVNAGLTDRAENTVQAHRRQRPQRNR